MKRYSLIAALTLVVIALSACNNTILESKQSEDSTQYINDQSNTTENYDWSDYEVALPEEITNNINNYEVREKTQY